MNPTPLLLLGLLLAATFAQCEPAGEDNSTYSRKVILPLVKSPGKDKNLFKTFKIDGDSQWNPNFWAASLGFDQFTGIGWGTPRAGVLVTPEHVISAAHYGNNEKGVHFYSEDGGFLGIRHIARDTENKFLLSRLPNDIRVARLESPAPKGARIYPLPDPKTDEQRISWCSLPENQRPLLLATDWRSPVPKKNPADPKEGQQWRITRSAHPVLLKRISGGAMGWTYGPRGEPAVHPSYHEIINVGDSSHPLFWVTKSGLVLASTFTGTGSGPNYGNPEVQTAIQEAIDKLGGTKQYKLKTAPTP
jgi:hypothetical protein